MKSKIKLVVSLFSIALIGMAAMNISPALSSIAAAYPEVPREMIQLLITIPSFIMIFASLCSAFIVKRISIKNTVLLGAAVFTSAGILPVFTDDFTMMLASRAIIGIGLGIMAPLATTIIFQQFADARQRNNMMGWQSCAGAVGNITTMSLAGLLAVYGYQTVFFVHLLGLVTFFVVLIFMPGRDSHAGAATAEADNKRMVNSGGRLSFATIRWLFLPFLYTTFLHCFAINLSMLVEESGFGNSAVSGLGLSMLTVGSFTCGFFYGRIAGFMKQYTMPVGILVSSAGLLIMALAHSPVAVYASGVCTGFGMGMVTPVIVTYIVCSAAPEMTTLVIALSGAMTNLGLSVAPYTVSWVSSIFAGDSIRGRYYVCAGILMVMGVIMLVPALAGKLANPGAVKRTANT